MSKKRGKIVETKTGKKGYVYNNDAVFGGKIKVHVIDENLSLTGKKLLCKVEDLKIIGFKD